MANNKERPASRADVLREALEKGQRKKEKERIQILREALEKPSKKEEPKEEEAEVTEEMITEEGEPEEAIRKEQDEKLKALRQEISFGKGRDKEEKKGEAEELLAEISRQFRREYERRQEARKNLDDWEMRLYKIAGPAKKETVKQLIDETLAAHGEENLKKEDLAGWLQEIREEREAKEADISEFQNVETGGEIEVPQVLTQPKKMEKMGAVSAKALADNMEHANHIDFEREINQLKENGIINFSGSSYFAVRAKLEAYQEAMTALANKLNNINPKEKLAYNVKKGKVSRWLQKFRIKRKADPEEWDKFREWADSYEEIKRAHQELSKSYTKMDNQVYSVLGSGNTRRIAIRGIGVRI